MTRLRFTGSAIAVLMAASLGACQKPQAAKPAADTGKIADAVKADATQRTADVNAHDAAKFAGHFAADGIAMRSGRPNSVGTAAIQAELARSFAATPDLHITVSDPTVDVAASGDLAVYRATSVATMTDPKTHKPATVTRNSLAEYKQQPDGSWKIAWSIVSDVAPAEAGGTPAPKT